ncbi:Listeria/Bacterioides repeat-containing protein, partial [Lachnospiraceae bacterium KH1T2]
MKNNKTLSILLTVALAFANTGGGVPTYAAEDAEAVVDAAEDTGVETESDGEEVGPQAEGTTKELKTSLGYNLTSTEKFSYTQTTEGKTTNIAISEIGANVELSGELKSDSTALEINFNPKYKAVTPSDAEESTTITTSLVLANDFKGNEGLTLNISTPEAGEGETVKNKNVLDLTNVIPAVGETIDIAKINGPVYINPEGLDFDKYVYRLTQEKITTAEENEEPTVKPTITDFDSEGTATLNSDDGLVKFSCIERNAEELTLNVTTAGKTATTDQDAADAKAITEAINSGASEITLKLSSDADVLVIPGTIGSDDSNPLFTAFNKAITAGIPVTIVLNNKTAIEFNSKTDIPTTADLTFTATRLEKEVASFTDEAGTSYTYKNFAGEFSVISGSGNTLNDITENFKFTLSDLPTDLTKKEAGSAKYSLFAQLGKANKNSETGAVKREILTDGNSESPKAAAVPFDGKVFADQTVTFTPVVIASAEEEAPDATWYLLDCEVATDHIYFDANVPEGFTFEYDEDSLAKNYPSVYAVSDNKTTLVASIPTLTTSDVILPSGNAVKLTKKNKPYVLYGWATKKISPAKKDANDEYYVLKENGTIGETITVGDVTTDVREKTTDGWTPVTIGKLLEAEDTKKPTYYAVWYADKARVTFDLNFEGATIDDFSLHTGYSEDTENNQLYVEYADATDASEHEYTAPIVRPNVYKDHTFIGWATDKDATEAELDSQFPFNYEYSGGTTYYAVWESSTTVEATTVTFDANGGEFTSTPAGYTKDGNVLTVKFDNDKADAVAVPTSSALKRTGYKFVGWSASKTGAANSSLTKVDYNTGTSTLYAVWEKTSDENPSDDNPGTDDPGTDDPGKEDSGNNNETPSANTTPSVNYVEKTVAAATVDGKSVSVCYASKQLYQGRKLKNFDAIDYITINGVSYNGSKVVVKVSKGKDAGSKVTFLIKKIKGESKEFNKALKAQKLTYTVEIVPVD